MRKIKIPEPHPSEWMLLPVLIVLLPFVLVIIGVRKLLELVFETR